MGHLQVGVRPALTWLCVVAVLTVAVAFPITPAAVRAITTESAQDTATFEATTVGDTAFETLEVHSSDGPVTTTSHVRTRRSSRYCLYSEWHLLRINAVTLDRYYGVFVRNACYADHQVFPRPADPRFGPCDNDDSLYPSARYSLCPVLQSHHVPAGLTPHDCDALSVASTALHATLIPDTYDPRLPTVLTATTSFASDIAERLSDGTCLANLDWRDTGWRIRWSDNITDTRPGSGRSGITDAHLLAPQPTTTETARTADITAIAILHLTGDAVDFDEAGSPTVVHRAADVRISNHRTATGMAPGTVDTPPQLEPAAIPVGQRGDGTVPPPDPARRPLTHADTIRGRLLELYPRVLVVRPGTESVDGVVLGETRSEVVDWTYLGPPTDAPSREATPPGATDPPTVPVSLQWNHAERLDGRRRPVDEVVPLRLTVRTTYPDGHSETQVLTGAISVSIWYVALLNVG